MSVLSEKEISTLLGPTGRARSLPSRIYFSPEFYDFDRSEIFAKGWMAVGFGAEIPAAGSIKPIQFAGYELLLVRDNDMEIHCFHNICRHRGYKLVHESARGQRKMSCKYHCWTYALTGELTGTPHIDGIKVSDHDALDKPNLGLLEIRTEIWFDMVFVNLDGNAPPLSEHLAAVDERLATQDFDAVESEGVFVDYVRNANWKIVIETGIEDYHLPFVHSILDYNPTYTDENAGDVYQGFSADWDIERLAMRADPEHGGEISKPLPLLPSYEGKEKGESVVLFLLPTGQITIGANMIRLTTLNPVAVDKTILHHAFYFRGEAAYSEEYAIARREIIDFWKLVGDEDDDLMAIMQSMSLAKHEAGLLGAYSPRWERNLHQFHHYLGRQYGPKTD
ncbi:MAG: aromatic ring-hydroxylating dioxygenase subunit alpha [Pseudomonadota bacterium]